MSEPGLFAAVFSTPELDELFSARSWLQALLDFEAALARVQARAGRVPQSAADAIVAACRAERFAPESLAREAAAAGNPVIPLVRRLAEALPREAADFVHLGATSQDALDSALMRLCRTGLERIDADLAVVSARCAELADSHRETPMPARTLLQHALPTSFGLKAAGWLDALGDARARLAALGRDGLALQLGGAAGTLAALEPGGTALVRALARELDLSEPALPWHTQRGRVAELACALGVIAGVLGKLALDLALASQTEVGELRETGGPARGGSSTLPQKRNPVGAAGALACAKRAPGLVAALLAALPQEHERAVGGWQIEWETLPELFRVTGAAARHLGEALRELEVDAARMRANLSLTGGALLAERLAFALAPKLGRLTAAERVADACRRAEREGLDLRELLARDAELAPALSGLDLDELLDPTHYLGAASELVDRALERHRRR
jgi:3-carboxy-cis,cis-muconate cycloisomerase